MEIIIRYFFKLKSPPQKHDYRRTLFSHAPVAFGVPFDNNPNLVVPIGDGFGFVIYLN